MDVIERWVKRETGFPEIEVLVVKDKWGYQPTVNGKPIHKMDADLESLHDTLFGNGCMLCSENNKLTSSSVTIPAWKMIDWDLVRKQMLEKPELVQKFAEAERTKKDNTRSSTLPFVDKER